MALCCDVTMKLTFFIFVCLFLLYCGANCHAVAGSNVGLFCHTLSKTLQIEGNLGQASAAGEFRGFLQEIN